MQKAETIETKFASAPVPISPFEDMWCRVGDRFQGDGTGAIVARVRGQIEDTKIRTALDLVQQRHPKLRARVVLKKDGNRYFEFPDPPPRIPLEIKDSDGGVKWVDEAFRVLCIKMEIAIGPLCRMLLVRALDEGMCYIVFIAHHAIIDAASMIRIVEDMLEFYRDLEAGIPIAPVVSRPLVSIARAPAAGTFLRKLRMFAAVVVMRIEKKRGNWITLPETKYDPPHPWVERHIFTEEDTATFTRRCREERTSFSTALFSAAVSALVDIVPEEEFRLRCRMPMSIRHMLEGPEGAISPHDLGCFISGFGGTFKVNKQLAFWDFSRLLWRQMEDYVLAGGPQTFYNMVKLAKYGAPRTPPKRDTLSVNYLGVAKVRGEYGSLRLEECLTLAKNSSLGPSFNVWAITVRGRLCVWLGVSDISDELAETYWQAVLKQLRKAMEPKAP